MLSVGSAAGGQVVWQVGAALSPALPPSFCPLAPRGATHCHSALATVSPIPGSCPPFGAVLGSVPASSLGNLCGVELVDSSPQLLGVNLPSSSLLCCLSMCVCVLSCVRLFVTPVDCSHQAPLSMGFPRQEYWSGLLFPSLGESS